MTNIYIIFQVLYVLSYFFKTFFLSYIFFITIIYIKTKRINVIYEWLKAVNLCINVICFQLKTLVSHKSINTCLVIAKLIWISSVSSYVTLESCGIIWFRTKITQNTQLELLYHIQYYVNRISNDDLCTKTEIQIWVWPAV